MSKRADVGDGLALGVLGFLGLLTYAKWAITGRPEWAKARTSYST